MGGDVAIKTLVYQSFRIHDVPEWIKTCMASVKAWVEHWGYSYKFIDDSFFQQVPKWFYESVQGQRHLVSDLARLELASQYLSQGWDRVIWLDADVFICDIDNFTLASEHNYLLCRELWVTSRDNEIFFSDKVNNSVLVFCKNNKFLDFYRNACLRLIRSRQGTLRRTEIGTEFLTGIAHLLPLIETSVTFSPFLLSAFYHRDEKVIAAYLQRLSHPMQAINLCLTFRNTHYQNLLLTDDVFATVIDNVKNTG